MQKTINFLAIAALLGCGSVFAASPAISDSVLTVDQLLRLDNATAREKAKKEAIAAGFVQKEAVADGKSRPSAPVVTPNADVTVRSISGVDGKYNIDLVYNGTPFQGVHIGTKVQSCVVAAVRGTCVDLKGAVKPVATSAKKSKKDDATATEQSASASAKMCPSACWTGAAAPAVGVAGAPGAPLPGGEMPLPIRAPQSQVAPKANTAY